MNTARKPRQRVAKESKADRIKAAARELLIAWGYRRITIDDITRRAQVGKGTLYLYWPSKEALFDALILDEVVTGIRDMIATLEADPMVAVPHRFLPLTLQFVVERPILKARFAGDLETLGTLTETGPSSEYLRAGGPFGLLVDVVSLFRRHGLVRTDRDELQQFRAIDSVFIGFFAAKTLNNDVPFDEVLAALATTVTDAFEPRNGVNSDALGRAAKEMIAIFRQTIDAIASDSGKDPDPANSSPLTLKEEAYD